MTNLPLPSLTDLSSATDLSKTVQPFLHQFTTSPFTLYQANIKHGFDISHFVRFYTETNPAITALLFAQLVSIFTFLSAQISGDWSSVDRLWSILPAIYIGHFCFFGHLAGLPTQRLDMLAGCATFWTIRLTYNFYRKGGYGKGGEDYRWPVVRSWMNRWQRSLFNLFFVAWFQNVLLFLVTTPAYVLLLVATLKADVYPGVENIHSFGTADLILSRMLILALITEFFADQQQWKYQQAKKEYKATGIVPENSGFLKSDLERGFCVQGLWSFSRHPNFLAEQLIWILIYVWSCFVSDTAFNWTGIGAFLYCAVFQGSTWLTEKLSCEKYPEYKEYQRLVNRFVPKWDSFLVRETKEETAKKDQ